MGWVQSQQPTRCGRSSTKIVSTSSAASISSTTKSFVTKSPRAAVPDPLGSAPTSAHQRGQIARNLDRFSSILGGERAVSQKCPRKGRPVVSLVVSEALNEEASLRQGWCARRCMDWLACPSQVTDRDGAHRAARQRHPQVNITSGVGPAVGRLPSHPGHRRWCPPAGTGALARCMKADTPARGRCARSASHPWTTRCR